MEQVRAGDTLGHYRIIETLGRGGMGEVYAAEDTKLHRKVALKVLPSVFATDPERRRRFEREAQTIAALNHPGIVTIYSVEVDGPVPFLTMELVDGRPLRDAIRTGGMALDALLRTAIAQTDAVAAAHQRGIVHRDLKPANVMVCGDGRVKVLDFGLAKLHEPEAAQAGETATHLRTDDLTGEGRIVGTVAYMSPEQAEGKSVDQRSDIFSLGVMLHEMATGERPFKGDTEVSIISSIIKDAPAPVTDSRPELPQQLARIIKRCLIKDPQRRYQSARDLHTDLEDLKQDLDSGVLSTPSGVRDGDAHTKAFRVPRAIAYAVATMVLVLGGIAVSVAIDRRLTAPRVFVPGQFQRLTDSGGVFSMALSADGRYVAYSQKENGLTSLWIRQTATESKAQIAPPTDHTVADVAFSPDGNLVYYTARPSDSRIATLYRVSSLGGRVSRVLDGVDSNISFSPDGKRISFRRGSMVEGKTMLMVAAADGSSVRELAPSEKPRIFDDMPAPWSPDGRSIVAIEAAVTNAETPRLVSVDVASGRRTPLGADWAELAGIAWMPDGRSVIVAAADALLPAHVQLWQVAWPAGTRTQLTFGLNDYDNVAVSADGRTVAAIEDEYNSNIWVQPLSGGPGRQITSNVRGDTGDVALAWTPDGRIVYSAFSGNNAPQLWIMDADGAHARQLTTMFAMMAAVSPEGKWIYFAGGATPSEVSIWKLAADADGGDPVRLTSGKADANPIVSPDGRTLYFSSREGPLVRTMRMSTTDGGRPTPLTEPEPGFVIIQLSQDGSHLLGFAVNRATHRLQAVRLSIEGGPLEFVDNVPSNGGPLPDGTGWIFKDTRDAIHGLFLRPLAGGADRLLVDVGQEFISDFDVSRNSRTLAFVRSHDTSGVVLIRAK